LEKITIDTGESRSEILIGADWTEVKDLIPAGNTVIITDHNVRRIYGDRFPDMTVISVAPGEESKRLSVVEDLAGQLLEKGVDRNGFILAIGGGVVCDLAGFLASVYLRGIGCGYVSTSLLAQVDASTGGKNGVNLGGTKNVIGVIRQPGFVICDTGMLSTLTDEEYLSGLAEMIKTAVIGDRILFEMIESGHDRILERDKHLLTELVVRSVRFKAAVVTEDEKEKGLRRILNLGHTFGHAIEMQTYVRHGFAVAAGMELAAEFSFEKGLIDNDTKDRIIALLNKFGLIPEYTIPAGIIRNLVLHDKKKAGSGIHFVFSSGIGKVVVEKIPVDEVIDFYIRFTDKK
jgi:3-dehydroquinate synthase